MNLIPLHRSTHRNTYCSQQRIGGVTLFELLVTLVVLAIVLAYAIPAFNGLIGHTRLTAVTNNLVAHLQYARSTAVRLGRERVAVGPCNSSGAWLKGDAWEPGYMVADVDADMDATGTPKILNIRRRVDASDLTGITITTNGPSPRFYFHPDGSSSVSATLTVCDKADPTNARAVVVDNVGRIRTSTFAPGGKQIVCPTR